jgi:hypothetical protein
MKRFLLLAAATTAAATVGCASTPPPPRQPVAMPGFPGTDMAPNGAMQPTQTGGMQQPMQGAMQQPMQGGMTQTGGMMPQGGQTYSPAAMNGAGVR